MAANSKSLPANKEAEKYVISNSLANPQSAAYVVNELTVEDFTEFKYQSIFQAILHLYKLNKSLGISSIIATLDELNLLGDIGGSDYINELLNEFLDFDSLEDNIRLLQDKKIARNLIKKMNELNTNYYANKYDTDLEFLNTSELQITEIIRSRRVEGFKNLKDISARIKSNIEFAKSNDDNLIGLDTGLYELNKFTSGMQKGQMIVIAARPGVGKTALGLNICYNIAEKYNRPVLVFSAEMGEEEVGIRLLSAATTISGLKISTGNISNDELIKLHSGINKVSKVPLLVSYCNGTTIGEIINKCTKFKSEHNDLAMIMVDYIGLIRTGQKEESTRIEIGKISHALKKLAIDLQIPVIVVSQVRRTENKTPMMSDLKESGDIEQDADKVILLSRDDYEGDQDKKSKSNSQEQQGMTSEINLDAQKQKMSHTDPNTSIVEVNLAKNRNGSTGVGYLLFFKSYQKFANPTKELIEDYTLSKKRTQ